MKRFMPDVIMGVLIILISFVCVSDLFFFPGQLASFDSPFHITNIAQFSLGLQEKTFPVVWFDRFGNYGLPIGLVAHQVPNYIGALINMVLHNPEASFVVVLLLGIVVSNLLYYLFLRQYVEPLYAYLGVFLFTFSAYRLLNIFVRGAMPEIFSTIFLPAILLSSLLFITKRKAYAFFLLVVSFSLLLLSHPMMFLIYSFIFMPYIVFLLYQHTKTYGWKKGKTIWYIASVGAALLVSIGIASYYIIPLNLEIKYFYYGLMKNHLTPHNYTSLLTYFSEQWPYFAKEEVFTRGHVVQFGLIETIGLCLGIVLGVSALMRKKEKNVFMFFALATTFVVLFFTTRFSDLLYTHISLLGNIQFPWRMLSALAFFPPLFYALFFQKIGKKMLVICCIVVVALVRFPQLYSKNVTVYPQSSYYFTIKNMHSVFMNTIWTEKTENYPVKKQKIEVIEGEGSITKQIVSGTRRQYLLSAKTPLRLVDYTFYFPGWTLYIDGVKQPDTAIQFQNPAYRGVITYGVAAGNHEVKLVFADTKIRFLSKMISLCSFVFLVILFIFRKPLVKKVGLYA